MKVENPEAHARAVGHSMAALRHNDSWLVNSLHQSDVRGGRGWVSEADCFAYCWLSHLVESGELALRTFPTESWARPDDDFEGNEALLNKLDGIEVLVHEPSTHGHDGIVNLLRDSDFVQVPVVDDEFTETDTLPVRGSSSFPLEVGTCSLAKSIMTLLMRGRLARFPYPIKGGQPMLFLFSLRRPTAYSNSIGELFDARGA